MTPVTGDRADENTLELDEGVTVMVKEKELVSVGVGLGVTTIVVTAVVTE